MGCAYMEITEFQQLVSSVLLTHPGQLSSEPVFLYSAFENKFYILPYIAADEKLFTWVMEKSAIPFFK